MSEQRLEDTGSVLVEGGAQVVPPAPEPAPAQPSMEDLLAQYDREVSNPPRTP